MASHGTRITYKLISLLSQNGNCCVTLAEQYSTTISTKIKTKKKNSGSHKKKKNKEEEMLNPFHKQTTKTYAVILRPFFSTSHTIEVRF